MSCQFNTLKDDQKSLIKDIDKSVKNKWNFRWCEETVTVKEFKVKLGDTIDKLNVPGKALCKLCNAVINYGGRGKGALKEHMNSDCHYQKLKLQQSNYNIGSFAGKKDKLFPLFQKSSQRNSSKPDATLTLNPDKSRPVEQDLTQTLDDKNTPSAKTTIPLSDRVATMEAMILSTMAEHSMPLTFAPVLVELARTCSRDLKALAQVQLSSCSAAYKLKYGLAKTILESLILDLQSTPFSLNIDEATSSNNKKVLSVLVNYFKGSETRIHHLASIEISRADSETIFHAICQIFNENALPWTNLISVLFDSCSVMRGSISGVETRLREEKAPHLLNIDGDSCHHMNNVAKRFCAPFERHLENLFADIYTDFKWCAEYKMSLQEICAILKLPYCVPQTSSTTRWLSCYDRAIETKQMWDALKMFYFSFLKKDDMDLYLPLIKELMVKRSVKLADSKRLFDISSSRRQRKMTKEGEERKMRIVSKLFYKSLETELQLELYVSVLSIMKEYVCVFQTKAPMIHKVYDYQAAAVHKFFQCFVRPEHIKKDVRSINISQSKILLPLRHIFIGFPKTKKTVPSSFLEQALKAYVEAGMQIQKCLLNNSSLESLSATDPSFNNHLIIKVHLEKLANKCSHLFDENQSADLRNEIRAYVNDKDLPLFEAKGRLDRWWGSSVLVSRYPKLVKLMKALITIFHGAQVESTFSVMSRIICKQTSRMDITMLSAIQTIKYELMSNRMTSTKYFYRSEPLYDPVCHQLCKNIRYAYKAHELKRQYAVRKTEILQKRDVAPPSVTAVKKLTALAKKRQFQKHVKDTAEPPPKKRKF